MKKAVGFVILAMVLIGSCAAQSANSDAQRIVGTWTQENDVGGVSSTGTVWVFNADGTGTRGGDNFIYGISAGGWISTNLKNINEGILFMSPNGRRMIISSSYGSIVIRKN